MKKVIKTIDNVIFVDFTPTKKKGNKRKSKVTGVFIKPCGVDESLYMIGGNLAGFIASYVAFHPEFSPELFGNQIRRELGATLGNEDQEPDPTPPPPRPTKKALAA